MEVQQGLSNDAHTPRLDPHVINTLLNQLGRTNIATMENRPFHQARGFFRDFLGFEKRVRGTYESHGPRARKVQFAVLVTDRRPIHSEAIAEAKSLHGGVECYLLVVN
jgi:hypothetical protein